MTIAMFGNVRAPAATHNEERTKAKVRLIKPNTPPSPPSKETEEQPPDQVQIINTIRSWVREFKSTKTDRARLTLRQTITTKEDDL